MEDSGEQKGQSLCHSYRLLTTLCCCVAVSLSVSSSTSMSSAMLCMFTMDQTFLKDNHTGRPAMIQEKSPDSGNTWTFTWDSNTRGAAMSSFFFGFCIMQIPAGAVATKFGPRGSIVAGLFGTAIFHILSVPAARWNVTLLYVVRGLAGMICANIIPGVYGMMANWSPRHESSFLFGIATSGVEIGNSLSFGLSLFSCEIEFQRGWPFVFYTLGFLHIAIGLVFLTVTSNFPATHRWISPQEANYIYSNSAYRETKPNSRLPLRRILTSGPVWAFMFAQLGSDWAYYVMVTQVGLFSRRILELSAMETSFIMSASTVSILPLAYLLGYITDVVINKNIFSVTNVRKIDVTMGSILNIGTMIAFGFCPKGEVTIFFLVFFIGALASTFAYSGYMVNPGDLSPAHASFLSGLSLGIGRWIVFVIPILTGYLTKGDRLEGWRMDFYITAGGVAMTLVVYLLLGSGELQPWASETEPDRVEATYEKEGNIYYELATKNTHESIQENGLRNVGDSTAYGSVGGQN